MLCYAHKFIIRLDISSFNMQITGLDIGTHTIKAIVAEVGGAGPARVLKILSAPSRGVRRGVVCDIDEMVSASSDIFSVLRKQFRAASRNIFVGVNGPQISSRISKGIIAVSRADNEIYRDDIERVVKASQAVSISPNRRIIHTLTREFVVDGVSDIADPMGLVGNRLEVESVVIDAFSPYLQSLQKVVDVSGCKLGGVVMSSVASARSVISKKQKELGVLLIDIGAGTTGIAMFEEGKLLHAAVAPIGATHITNDIAVGFKVPPHSAEEVKLEFGYALSRHVTPKDAIMARQAGGVETKISKRYLSEIIEARLAELFDFVNNEVKSVGRVGALPAGAVLVGGGAKLPGVAEFAKEALKLSCQIGAPEPQFEIVDSDYRAELDDPAFACVAGLVLCGKEIAGKERSFDISNWGGRAISFTTSFFKNLLP